MDAIRESLNSMMDAFNRRLDSIEEQLPKTSSVSPGSLEAEFAAFKTFAVASFRALQGQIGFLGQQIDQIEMRSRRKLLLLHGLPESDKEDTASLVVKTISERLQIAVASKDIKGCHRMGRTSSKEHPRPVLFKLHDMALRDKVWMAKTKLKGSGVTLSEFLTKMRHDLFLKARQRLGVSKCWTREGIVYALGPDASRHRIQCVEDIEALVPKEPATSTVQHKVVPPIGISKTRRAAASKK